jgi:PTS system beta-glucosides-specific IIC component
MMGGMGIFEFPAMIEPDGSMGNLIVAVTGVAITMVTAFAATMILYKEPELQKEEENKKPEEEKKDPSMIRKTVIASPMKGTVLKLSDIKDEAFASGVLGKGAAILPEEGNVYAPADGRITALFPTLHAIGMRTEDGAELLIHIGLDTVQLNGEGFEAHVKEDSQVKKGQLLISFDRALLEGKGYCLETPVLITNADDYLEVLETVEGAIRPGEELLKALR